jgi:hypothetical protein
MLDDHAPRVWATQYLLHAAAFDLLPFDILGTSLTRKIRSHQLLFINAPYVDRQYHPSNFLRVFEKGDDRH